LQSVVAKAAINAALNVWIACSVAFTQCLWGQRLAIYNHSW
jgi:hypothetical protein